MNQNDIKTEILPVDPSWEYSAVHTRLNNLKDELAGIISYMGTIENPTKANDLQIKSELLSLIAKLRITAHDL